MPALPPSVLRRPRRAVTVLVAAALLPVGSVGLAFSASAGPTVSARASLAADRPQFLSLGASAVEVLDQRGFRIGTLPGLAGLRDAGWTPDGSMAFLVQELDGGWRLSLASRDLGAPRDITAALDGSSPRSAAWSPDGTRLLVATPEGAIALRVPALDTAIDDMRPQAVPVVGVPRVEWDGDGTGVLGLPLDHPGTDHVWRRDLATGAEDETALATTPQGTDLGVSGPTPDTVYVAHQDPATGNWALVLLDLWDGDVVREVAPLPSGPADVEPDLWRSTLLVRVYDDPWRESRADQFLRVRLGAGDAEVTPIGPAKRPWTRALRVVPVPTRLLSNDRCDTARATVRGTEGDDHLTGTDGPDVILALGGDDVVDGLGGDDVICGGTGDDTLIGGDGDDLVVGFSGDDGLDGGEGADTLLGYDGADRASGGAGDDTVDAGRGDDIVTGGTGGDTLYGGTGADDLAGEDGDDLLDGATPVTPRGRNFWEPGADRLSGGAGEDILRHAAGAGSVADGGDGDDLVETAMAAVGGEGDDVVVGDPESALHRRTSAYDPERGVFGRVDGGAGDDTITGGFAVQVLGGDGKDSIRVYGSALKVDAGAGDDLVRGMKEWFGVLAPASVDGGDGDDVLSGTTVAGGEGDDDIHAATATGGPGNDAMEGYTLDGGAGNDRLRGAVGGRPEYTRWDEDNTLLGGEGDDQLWGLAGDDVLNGGPGADRLFGGSGHDRLVGAGGDDVLWGGDQRDVLKGGNGKDVCHGGPGITDSSGCERLTVD